MSGGSTSALAERRCKGGPGASPRENICYQLSETRFPAFPGVRFTSRFTVKHYDH